MTTEPAPRRPALTVLAVLLMAWEPTAFALYASSVVDRIVERGVGEQLLLALRLAVLGVGIAAGRGLWSARPGALTLAQAALGLSALATLAAAAAGTWPQNRAPGTVAPLTALVLLYDAAWLVYLRHVARRDA